VQQGSQQSDKALITWAQDVSEGAGFLKLMELDTRTGKLEEIDVPPWSQGFLIGDDDQPVAAGTARGDRAQIRWREGSSGRDWRVLRDSDRFVGEAMHLLGQTPDGKIYVSARRGHDQLALYTYDPKTDQLSEKPLLAVAQFDIHPELIRRDGKLLGARVAADATATVWFEPTYKALQAKLDERLPNTNNVLQIPRRGPSPWLVVWAFSDLRPGEAYAFNRETGKLVLLGRTLAQIDPAQMSAMDFITYKARDGLGIPAFITLPRSSATQKNLPLVVYAHGGPWARGGYWAWNSEVQFLASRGYAVIQPDFRGSTGYGDKLFKAGWRQWGQAMQDDLADAAKWAIDQGIADPKRIAIVGASYGGYAAMMGLVRHPEVFACAVNWVGVTDMELLFAKNWGDDIPTIAKTHGMTKLIGDPKADAEMLRANSPVHQAAKITKPVLMAYGRLDRRVPIEHGERMRDALKVHNKDVEWVVYDKEGHGWYRVETNVDFWGRVEKFLGRTLAPRA
jgi:acetyl esterase/lipase